MPGIRLRLSFLSTFLKSAISIKCNPNTAAGSLILTDNTTLCPKIFFKNCYDDCKQ